uniref:RING-type domain-containing protein n=1 Tax=Caenorhabditis tropicalis TaxID=1561998 RepID=A0A1I7U064_9PELO
MDSIYLLEQRKNKEVNLENIDDEMRMEQVRQAASKLEWASLGQTVRRNLLDKRNTIDADARLDVLKGISFMRTKMPIDETLPIEERVKAMAESLGCGHTKTSCGWVITRAEELYLEITINKEKMTTVVISLWDEPAFHSPDATILLLENKWTELRNLLAEMLLTYDKELNRDDRFKCQSAMEMLKRLFNQYSSDNSYVAVQRSNYGYYLPPEDLRPGRVYYTVSPHYRTVCAKKQAYTMTKEDFDVLPYFEFRFQKHDKPCHLPELTSISEWSETVEANAVIVMKFSSGVLVSESTRKKLAEFCAMSPSIRHYTNSYRYLTGEISIENAVKMVTQFDDGKAQHLYEIDRTSFHNEGDSVISEVYLKRLQDFHLVIALLRTESMHMNFWESLMASCYEKQGMQDHVVGAISMNVSLSRTLTTINFMTKYAPISVHITDSETGESKVEVVNSFNKQKIADRINEISTRKLNETWSIPIMLTHVVSEDDVQLVKIKVPLRKENPETSTNH